MEETETPLLPDRRALKVFVVDDDLSICDYVRVIAEDCGFFVEFATRAGEFRERYAGSTPDIVVTDVAMPSEDGIALLEFLRSQDFSNPVILISQFDGYLKSAAIFARTVGFRNVQMMAKPLTLPKVRDALFRAAELRDFERPG